jgi:hypothetical protein
LFFSLFVSLLPLLSPPFQGKLTPLHAAALYRHADVAKVLLAAGANVHATDDVSGEGWGIRLDYRDGVPYLRGEVG